MAHKVAIERIRWDELEDENDRIEPRVSNPKTNRLGIIASALIVVLLIGTSLGVMISATSPNIPTVIEPGSMVGDASYVIFKDSSGITYAKNETTGAIEYFDSNSSATIQYAMTNLGTSGGIILICVGSYTIPTGLSPGINQIIRGEGEGTILSLSVGVYIGITLNAGVVVENLRVTGSATYAIGYEGSFSYDQRVRNCEFAMTAGISIYIRFSQSFVVEGNRVYASPSLGIWSDRNTQGLISHNYIYRSGSTGILSKGDKGVVISDNIVVESPYAVEYAAAISVYNGVTNGRVSNGMVVADNRIVWYETPAKTIIGILIDGEEPYDSSVDGVSVVGNTIEGWGSHLGIAIYTHIFPTAAVPNIQNLVIQGNVIKNWSTGITYSGERIAVIGNIIDNVSIGIWAWSANNSVIYSNIIRGNESIVGHYGIELNKGSNISVFDNRVETFTTGILESGVSNYNQFERNTITACTIALTKIGTNSVVRFNIGYVTENRGNQSITGGVNSVSFNHGLVSTPTLVLVTPVQTGYGNISVVANATQITINFDNQPGGATWYFHWYAEV